MIIRCVCRISGVRKVDVLSIRRDRNMVQARQVAMWLARRHTALSYPTIGRLIGGRDHTTVMHALRKVDAVVERMRAGLPMLPTDRHLATLARRAEATLLRELGAQVVDEAEAGWRQYLSLQRECNARHWQDYLTRQRERNRERCRVWHQQHEAARQQALLRRVFRPAPAKASSVRHVPMSGCARVHVPRGCSITAVLMGDPLPERSALHQRHQEHQPRDWQAWLRNGLSAARAKQRNQRKEQEQWQ